MEFSDFFYFFQNFFFRPLYRKFYRFIDDNLDFQTPLMYVITRFNGVKNKKFINKFIIIVIQEKSSVIKKPVFFSKKRTKEKARMSDTIKFRKKRVKRGDWAELLLNSIYLSLYSFSIFLETAINSESHNQTIVLGVK